MKHRHEDFGEFIPFSRKEIYQIANENIYKVTKASVWPKRSLNDLKFEDIFCKYLIECIYSQIKNTFRSHDNDQVDVFIHQVQWIRDALLSTKNEDNIWEVIKKINYGVIGEQRIINEKLVFKRSHFDMTHLNRKALRESMYGMSPKEKAHTLYIRAKRGLNLFHWDECCSIDFEREELIQSIPESGDTFIYKILDFESISLEDINPENDFLVDQGEVIKFPAERYDYLKVMIDRMNESLKKSGTVETNVEENPGNRKGPKFFNRQITGEDLMETFGLRGGQYGNYVSQGLRAGTLNQLAQALFDMCDTLDIDPETVSLDGRIGVSFGARGKGGKSSAAAHYEDQYVVINITKKYLKKGGVFIHEFLHSLDAFLGNSDLFLSEIPKTNYKSFDQIMKIITDPKSRFYQDARALDSGKKPYWSSRKELFARAGSSAVINIMKKQNRSNDWLAFNYNDFVKKDGKIISANPQEEELEVLSELFSQFFEELKDKGIFKKLENKEDLCLKVKSTSFIKEVDETITGDQIEYFK